MSGYGMAINRLQINPYQYISFKGASNRETKKEAPSINIYQSSPIAPTYNKISPKNVEKTGEISIPYSKKAQVYKLANGQTAVILNKKGPTTINTYVKVGSFNEPDNIRGISHFIEHNLFNGSKNLEPNQFVAETHQMGAIYNASTGFASTNYFLTSPVHSKEDLDKMIKMHADMLETPRFAPDMLKKEKDIVSSEIQMLEDNPYQKIENLLIKNLFQIKSSSIDMIGGTVPNIQGLSRNSVEDYYNTYYSPDNMVTVVVGDVDCDEIANKLNKNFISRRKPSSNKTNEPLKPIEKPFKETIEVAKIDSPMVGVSFVGPKNHDIKKQIATDALLNFMTTNKNSPFYKHLDSLNAEVMANSEAISNNNQDNSAISLLTSFPDGLEAQGLNAIKNGIEELKSTPISEKDLATIKQELKNNYIVLSESSMALSNLIGMTTINNSLDDIQKYHDEINNLTANDIQNAAKEFLNMEKSCVIIAKPKKQSTINSQNPTQITFGGNQIKSDALNSIDFENITKTPLKNNLQAIYHQNDAPFSYAQIKFKNPSIKKYTNGTDIILSSMLNKGSSINPKEKFDEKTSLINSKIDFSTENDSLIVNFATPQENMKEALDLVQEVLFNPDLTEENFQKSKEKIILMTKQSPLESSDEAIANLYPNDPSKIPLKELIKNFDKIKLQDVINLYYDIMTTPQAETIISAPEDFKTKNLLSFQNIPLQFNSYEHKFVQDTTPLEHTKVITQEEDVYQADITQAFKLSTDADIKEIASLMVMNTILQEGENGLFNDLRENQKLCYTVRSFFINEEKSPHLLLKIKTSTEDPKSGFVDHKNIEKSIKGFEKHLNNMINNKVDEEDLKNAKLKLISNMVFACENSAKKHALVSKAQDTTLEYNYIQQLPKEIIKITAEDIQKTAHKNLTKPSSISIIANKNSLEANKEFLDNLEKKL